MPKKNLKKSKKKSFAVWLWVGAAVILVAVLVVVVTSAHGHQTSALPREISVAKANEMRTAGAFVLDVRELSEWQQVHIPGATLIPLGELPDRLSELPENQDIVVVCHSGNRSAKGRDILLAAGFTRVTSMAGGMTRWQAAGYAVTSGN